MFLGQRIIRQTKGAASVTSTPSFPTRRWPRSSGRSRPSRGAPRSASSWPSCRARSTPSCGAGRLTSATPRQSAPSPTSAEYAWWRVMRWLRKKHPRLDVEAGATALLRQGTPSRPAGLTLYNPATMRVERYRYRGAADLVPRGTRRPSIPRAGASGAPSHDDPESLDRAR